MQTQTPAASQPSLLTPIGYRNSSCGYCHSKSGSQSQKRFSYYVSAPSLTPKFYQSLLDRGWRRSGTLLYKPNQRASCCPQYTIRLDSDEFRASKDQRQVQNRFSKYILGDEYVKEAARLHPRSREEAKKRNTEFDLLERVHECEKEQVLVPPEPAHTFTVTLQPDDFTEEKFALFENYQRLVHHEPPHRITKIGFKKFLCSSPLPKSRPIFDLKELQPGSYHQCYRIDGKLVAVGVLDILPQCVSAVYFMYDSSVSEHSFGKLGAMREIALAKETHYKFWYAGFYIHSCAKMRYKGDYSPQYILDPESLGWDLLDVELKKKLDMTKYFSLSREMAGLAEGSPPSEDDSTKPADTSKDDTNFDSSIPGDSDDSDDDPPLSDPDTPLFERSMPGVLSKAQLQDEVDLDSVKLLVRGTETKAKYLVSWDTSDLDDPNSIKGIIAELAAAVGPDLTKQMVVKFG